MAGQLVLDVYDIETDASKLANAYVLAHTSDLHESGHKKTVRVKLEDTDTVYDDTELRNAISEESQVRSETDSNLQTQIEALQGAIIYLGNINLSTAQITANTALLTQWAQTNGFYPLKTGYVIIDSQANDWWWNGTAWVNIGYYEVATATNASKGVVKGSTADMKVGVDGSGEMSVNNLQAKLDAKQNTLTPGVNIQISGSTISATDTIPSNGILTIQQDGTNKGTFGANQASNATINIDLSGKVSNSFVTIPNSSPPSAWGLGFQMGQVYNNGYPVPYGTIFSIKGSTTSSVTQILVQWSGADKGLGDVLFRNARDNHDGFSEWTRVAKASEIPDISGKMDKPNGTASQVILGNGGLNRSSEDTSNSYQDTPGGMLVYFLNNGAVQYTTPAIGGTGTTYSVLEQIKNFNLFQIYNVGTTMSGYFVLTTSANLPFGAVKIFAMFGVSRSGLSFSAQGDLTTDIGQNSTSLLYLTIDTTGIVLSGSTQKSINWNNSIAKNPSAGSVTAAMYMVTLMYVGGGRWLRVCVV